jgi:predicted outer membrane repeat protein
MRISKFKKIIAMLLTVCLVFGAIPMTAFAEEEPLIISSVDITKTPETESSARAATGKVYTVTSQEGGGDANNPDNPAEGTLLWAFNQVNAGEGGDIVNISPVLAGKEISLSTTPLPLMTKSFTLNGNGVIINGLGSRQILIIENADVTVNRVTFLRGGTMNFDRDDGGAIYNDGGNLTVNNCVFTQNTAEQYGGAIYTNHHGTNTSATLTNCLFISNRGGDGGGVIYYDDGDGAGLKIINCTFMQNETNELYTGDFFHYKKDSTAPAPQFLNCILSTAAPLLARSPGIVTGDNATIDDVVFKNTDRKSVV